MNSIYPVPARKASGIIISSPFIDMLPMNIVQIVKKYDTFHIYYLVY